MDRKTFGAMTLAVVAGCPAAHAEWSPKSVAPEENVYAGGFFGQSGYTDANVADYDAFAVAALSSPFVSATNNGATLDDSDKGYGAVLGYRFSPFFAAEISYVDLGNVEYSGNLLLSGIFFGSDTVPAIVDVRQSNSGLGVSGLAHLPITEEWEIYGRGGFMLSNIDVRISATVQGQTSSSEFSTSSENLFAGLGAAYHFGEAITVRAELQRFFKVGTDDISETDLDFVGLQVLYRIL